MPTLFSYASFTTYMQCIVLLLQEAIGRHTHTRTPLMCVFVYLNQPFSSDKLGLSLLFHLLF